MCRDRAEEDRDMVVRWARLLGEDSDDFMTPLMERKHRCSDKGSTV